MSNTDYISANRKAYDLLAKEYETRAKHKSKYEDSVEKLAGIPLSIVKERFSTVSALEVGPGSGEVSTYLDENGCRTAAIDVSQEILKVVHVNSPHTKTIHADILAYDLDPEAYELLYAGALIHLFRKEHAELLMKKFYNALKANGVMFINTTIHEISEEGYFEKNDYIKTAKRFRHRYTEEEFRELVESSGLKIVQRLFANEKNRKKQWVAYILEKPNETN